MKLAKNPFRQLQVIRQASSNGKQIYDCYRLMYKNELWMNAFYELHHTQSIASAQQIIINEAIAELKSNTFRFKGKTNQSDTKDELALQVMTTILQSVFEPHFNKYCYNCYRKALLLIKNSWQSVTWCIEGDMKRFFPPFNSNILLKYISQKIRDHRFIVLLQNALSNGMINSRNNSMAQNNFSSVIVNIYLHKFDQFMEKLIKNFSHELEKRENVLCDVQACSYDVSLKYVRYESAFLIGIAGSKKMALAVKAVVKRFLHEELKMPICNELTLKHFSKRVDFLGYHLRRKRKNNRQKATPSIYDISLEIPKEKIIKFAARNRYGHFDTFCATHRTKLMNLSEQEIIAVYCRELKRFATYYKLANNFQQMKKLVNLAKRSCMMTIAMKRKQSIRKIATRIHDDFVSWNDLKKLRCDELASRIR